MKSRVILTVAAVLVMDCASAGWFSPVIKVSEMPVVDIGNIPKGKGSGDEEYRVIVAEVKSSHGSDVAPDLSTAAESALTRIIQEGGAQEVKVGRSIRDRLTQEFELYETRGESKYTPSQAANLAISGVITSAIITPKYIATSKTFDASQGKIVDAPPQCQYTATVQGSLTTWKVNPVERSYSAVLDGSDSLTMPAGSTSCKEVITKGRSDNLFLSALNKAMDSAAENLKNQFASSGIVVAARKDPKKDTYYYRLSIKPSSGAKPGVEVQFMENQTVAGKSEPFPFLTAKVACTNVPKYAYVKVNANESVDRIRAGTPVQLKFKGGVVTSVVKAASNIPGFGCDP